MKYVMLLLIILYSGRATAHEFTPTYPKLEQSYMEGVLKVSMRLFNKRNDIRYYQVGVYDDDWNKVPFVVMGGKIINVEYLETKNFDVYIQSKSRKKVRYICTMSKTLQDGKTKTLLKSRICSKVK